MGTIAAHSLVSAIRRESGLTQEALARDLGVSFATVNAWERGRSVPRAGHRRTLDQVAHRYGVRSDLLVLAIDDDPTACLVIEGLVAGSGTAASVETTTDPSKGLILAGALKPDILIIDVMMPGLDGFQVSEQLREILADQMPVIVFLTASTDVSVDKRADELGFAVFRKPMRAGDLNELLATSATGRPSPKTASY